MTPIRGISQVTTGAGNCRNPFTLGYQQSCTLTLQVNGYGLKDKVLGGPVVCQQGNSLQCYQPSKANSLDITVTNRVAYVTHDNSVSLCPVNSDGTFGSCNDSGNTGIPFNSPFGIILNNNHTLAYVANGTVPGNVVLCPLNTDGTFGACTDSGNTGIAFSQPVVIVLNKAQTRAYVTNQSTNFVSLCPINPDGTFGVCTNAGYPGPMQSASAIAINDTETLAYVSNTNNTISICSITSNGTFGSCMDSGFPPISGPDGLFDIKINKAGTLAYISSYPTNTVFVCTISHNGTFDSCVNSGNTGDAFNGPSGITFNNKGNIAYIANINNNLVYSCPIEFDGSFGSCMNSGNTGIAFDEPEYIALD